MRLFALFALALAACETPEPKDEIAPGRPHSFCSFEADGVCVIEDYKGSMNIDSAFVSYIFSTLEYEVNFFYPGLDFAKLAEEFKLKLNYKWADRNTQYQGTYSDYETWARVWLRRGETITPLMECMDRYYIAAHEVLHFVADRHLGFVANPEDEWPFSVHNVEYIFRAWATSNNLPVEYTVEGRLYTMIWRRCYAATQEAP